MFPLTPEQNLFYNCFSIFVILLCVVIIVVGIILIHELPYIIAKKRNHPQKDAIRCMSIMGLFLIPLWFGAMIWAYMKGKTYGAPFRDAKVEVTEIIVDNEEDKSDIMENLENRINAEKVERYKAMKPLKKDRKSTEPVSEKKDTDEVGNDDSVTNNKE